jgi:protein-L-isoaspartate(D-aspartate) O-methyltransferase
VRDPVEMMASTTLPFAAARQFMVDSQLRPNKVTNPILLDAMRQVPRETFLPPPLWSVAYADQDVRLGGGRVLIAPLAFARLARRPTAVGRRAR